MNFQLESPNESSLKLALLRVCLSRELVKLEFQGWKSFNQAALVRLCHESEPRESKVNVEYEKFDYEL